MKMTDPIARDLIQRLADALNDWNTGAPGGPWAFDAELVDEARAYLSAPDGPAVPTDAELHDLWLELYRFHDGPTGGEVATIARAALERWGSRTPAPIPLSERRPTEADCDAKGLCWFWHSDHKEDEFGDGWMLLKPEWADALHDSDDSPVYTNWTPYWALPVPGVEA